MKNLLLQGLEELSLPNQGEEARKLALYLEELEKWSPHLGLVASRGPDLVLRHLLDCLAGLQSIAALSPGRLADIGSGAGLPGVPLAVFLPQVAITLVESSIKRCAFLRSVVALMGLPNIRIFEGGYELLRESFDLLTFRAFRPLDRKLLRGLKKLLSPDGQIAAYKGRRDRFSPEVKIAASLGFKTQIEELRVPFLDEARHLLWLSIPAFPGPG